LAGFQVTTIGRFWVTAEGIEVGKVFPRSTRSVLLQSYLLGITWAQIPTDRQAELRQSLYMRVARRYCSSHGDGSVAVYSTLSRIMPFDQKQERGRRALMILFHCSSGEARVNAMNLDP
jgi:hypothetical protein